jgi:MFS transporter, DHA2 family, multidrug resistance protein
VPTPPSPPSPAPPAAWIGLAVLALPTLLVSMDMTILYLATPSLSADLKPTGAELLWISDIYGFLVAGALIPMGTLGDRIGRRRLLLGGALCFGLASALAAFASNPALLITARALLGLAGATLLPSTLALVRALFHEPRQRSVAISVWTSCFTLGGVAGPIVGGFLLEHFHWGAVFLIGLPVMLALLVLGPIFLPECREPQRRRLDLVSATLVVATVLATVWGLKQWAEWGSALVPGTAIAAGLVIGALFVRRQSRLPDPLIPPGLFGDGAFTVALAANTIALFAWVGASLLVAQHLQLVLGFSPLAAGLWTIPPAIACVLGCLAAPHLAQRSSPAAVVCSGLGLAALGLALMAGLTSGYRLAAVVGAMMVLGVGVSMIVTLGTDLMLTAAPPHMAGAASAVSETGAEFGGSLGVAVMGSIAFAVYRGGLVLPPGIGLQEGAAARHTLGGAVALAAELPDALGSALRAAAQEQFVGGLQRATGVGAAILVAVTLLFAWTVLRRSAAAITPETGETR